MTGRNLAPPMRKCISFSVAWKGYMFILLGVLKVIRTSFCLYVGYPSFSDLR
jgi:hypothetical protein